LIAGLVAATLGGTNALRAEPPSSSWLPEGAKAAQAMVQTWTIKGDRLFAELELTVSGAPSDSFLLLRPPAILTEFKSDGLRLSKVARDNQTAYYLVPERAGVLTATVRYEMALPDRAQGLAVPTGPAAMQRVTVELDQGGWDFVSPMAAQILPTPGLGENRSGATLVLSPEGAPLIRLRAKRRDLAAEVTQFFAEASNLYVPGPGVVNGFTRRRPAGPGASLRIGHRRSQGAHGGRRHGRDHRRLAFRPAEKPAACGPRTGPDRSLQIYC
jgi:hypothetical protein